MVYRGNGILPDELFLGNFRSQVAGLRTHVSVRQLVPRTRKGIRKFVGVLVESPRDLLVLRIKAQRKIGGQHGRLVLFGWIVRIGHCAFSGIAFRLPLVRSAWALGQFPVVLEKILKE